MAAILARRSLLVLRYRQLALIGYLLLEDHKLRLCLCKAPMRSLIECLFPDVHIEALPSTSLISLRTMRLIRSIILLGNEGVDTLLVYHIKTCSLLFCCSLHAL